MKRILLVLFSVSLIVIGCSNDIGNDEETALSNAKGNLSFTDLSSDGYGHPDYTVITIKHRTTEQSYKKNCSFQGNITFYELPTGYYSYSCVPNGAGNSTYGNASVNEDDTHTVSFKLGYF